MQLGSWAGCSEGNGQFSWGLGCAVHGGTVCATRERGALLLQASCSGFFPFLLWGEPGPGIGMAAAQRNCVSLLCCMCCWEQQQLQKDGNWLLSFLEQLLLFWSCWHGIDFPSRTAKRGLPMFSLSKFSRWGVAHLALHTTLCYSMSLCRLYSSGCPKECTVVLERKGYQLYLSLREIRRRGNTHLSQVSSRNDPGQV